MSVNLASATPSTTAAPDEQEIDVAESVIGSVPVVIPIAGAALIFMLAAIAVNLC